MLSVFPLKLRNVGRKISFLALASPFFWLGSSILPFSEVLSLRIPWDL
jgi:hypothetical protein